MQLTDTFQRSDGKLLGPSTDEFDHTLDDSDFNKGMHFKVRSV